MHYRIVRYAAKHTFYLAGFSPTNGDPIWTAGETEARTYADAHTLLAAWRGLSRTISHEEEELCLIVEIPTGDSR